MMPAAKAERPHGRSRAPSAPHLLVSLLKREEDYYRVLGAPPGSSKEQIKAAYRRRAMRLHPDRNPGEVAAEEAFKLCGTAYATLIDPDRRAEYDAKRMLKGGAARVVSGLLSDLTKGRIRPKIRGRDLRQSLVLTLEEVARGGDHFVHFSVDEICDDCQGSGAAVNGLRVCGECRGKGELPRQGLLALPRVCPGCGGGGERVATPCSVCDGVGMLEIEREYRVTLPPGVESGALKVLKGEGEAGLFGGDSGDLRIIVEIEKHALFIRQGRHASVEVPVSLSMACLGGRVDVPTLKSEVRMTVPRGTQSGKKFRIPNRGVGIGGDLIVEIVVETPMGVGDGVAKQLERTEAMLGQENYPRLTRFAEQLKRLGETKGV